jgi:hypothetical protein
MSDTVLIAVIPAAAALLGITISETFNRWKRREEFKRILFNKKFEFYSRLIAKTADILMDIILRMENETAPDDISVDPTEMFGFISSGILVSSEDIIEIASDFAVLMNSPQLALKVHVTELALIHRRLCERSKHELGLKSLEKDLKKMS